MNLDPIIEKLVLHWGEMGARWGISRMVSQIHALLYFSPKPMTADEIVEALGWRERAGNARRANATRRDG